ncbi:MAG: cytochrome c family protein [Chromatocurvus sp.]
MKGKRHIWLRAHHPGRVKHAIILLTLAIANQGALANDDEWSKRELMQGRIAFLKCRACHVVTGEDSGGKLGPSLAGVFGRVAGTARGYENYSSALRNAEFVWDAQAMDAWLADPEALVPGNLMVFPGIKDASARALLVRYLQQITDEDT